MIANSWGVDDLKSNVSPNSLSYHSRYNCCGLEPCNQR